MSGAELAIGIAGVAIPVLGLIGGVSASLIRGGRVLERVDQVHALTRDLHPAVDRLESSVGRLSAQVDGLHQVVRDHQQMPATVAHG